MCMSCVVMYYLLPFYVQILYQDDFALSTFEVPRFQSGHIKGLGCCRFLHNKFLYRISATRFASTVWVYEVLKNLL